MTTATASAAATVANLGPGFDVLGICLEGPRDQVTAELTTTGRVEILEIVGDDGRLPLAAEENCASVAAAAVLQRYAPGAGVRLRLRKGLPLGSGLGSSGASSVAAAVATAAVACPGVLAEDLLFACREGERLATGSPHPDNVAPSLLGGLVACVPREGEDIEVVRLPLPAGLYMAAVKPDVEVRTADARAAMPAAIPLADVVRTLASMASLIAGLAAGDLTAIGRSLGDWVATPYRKGFIPRYDDVVEAARQAGAVGAGISGSGPTVFALTAAELTAESAADAMVAVFADAGIDALRIVSAVDRVGARLI